MKIDLNNEVGLLQVSRVERARQFGSYYTPERTARALAKWAVRSGHEMILEPSAGGGALVTAAFQRARVLAQDPRLQITAFDIDPVAIEELKSLSLHNVNIKHEDFLEVATFESSFDVVLANPPFNRNHSLTDKRRTELRGRSNAPGAIGLWGHILLHSLKYLRRGGRLASIVPQSVLFTVHGKKFLQYLCENFGNVGLYELSSKPIWSNSAEEAGAVILADGFGDGVCTNYCSGYISDDGDLLPKALEQSGYYSDALRRSITLGDVAKLAIGTVTGRNAIFLLTEEERVAAGLSINDVRPVVSRVNQLKGITLSVKELRNFAMDGKKTWLLSPAEFNGRVQKYLEVIPQVDRETVNWFRKRSPWWKVQVVEGSDAVFTYMNDLGPRLVRISDGVTCTNTLHSVKFDPDVKNAQRLSAFLTPISTFGQLAAERIGRKYGGGILKFELGEARRLPVIEGCQFSDELLTHVDGLLRSGEFDEARDAVDNVLMQSVFGEEWKIALREMRAELVSLRLQRRGKKQKEFDECH